VPNNYRNEMTNSAGRARERVLSFSSLVLNGTNFCHAIAGCAYIACMMRARRLPDAFASYAISSTTPSDPSPWPALLDGA
jgi:hypothetical protein